VYDVIQNVFHKKSEVIAIYTVHCSCGHGTVQPFAILFVKRATMWGGMDLLEILEPNLTSFPERLTLHSFKLDCSVPTVQTKIHWRPVLLYYHVPYTNQLHESESLLRS